MPTCVGMTGSAAGESDSPAVGVTLIDAGSRDRLAGEMAARAAAPTHHYQRLGDLVIRDFACLALQDMDG
jgi:hypothetical protein